jgi:hypothetical protein
LRGNDREQRGRKIDRVHRSRDRGNLFFFINELLRSGGWRNLFSLEEVLSVFFRKFRVVMAITWKFFVWT